MGRKFIVEEVEEKSEFGCGSLIALAVILLIIGLFGGFKSCKEDKASSPAEIKTEQPVQTDIKKAIVPAYAPSTPRSDASTSASASTSSSTSKKGISNDLKVGSITEKVIDKIESRAPADNNDQSSLSTTETSPEEPAMTEKELRKAERQAKQEARRREKAQRND